MGNVVVRKSLNLYATVGIIVFLAMLPFLSLVVSMLETNPEASFGLVYILALLGSMLLLVMVAQ